MVISPDNKSIILNLSCGNCHHHHKISMSFEHASHILNGQKLSFVCEKCNARNDFSLKQIKHIFDNLPSDVQQELDDFIDEQSYRSEMYKSRNNYDKDSGWMGTVFVILVIIAIIGAFDYFTTTPCKREADGLLKEITKIGEDLQLYCNDTTKVHFDCKKKELFGDQVCTEITYDDLITKCTNLNNDLSIKLKVFKALDCTQPVYVDGPIKDAKSNIVYYKEDFPRLMTLERLQAYDTIQASTCEDRGKRTCNGVCWEDCPSGSTWKCDSIKGGICETAPSSCEAIGKHTCKGKCWENCRAGSYFICDDVKGGMCQQY